MAPSPSCPLKQRCPNNACAGAERRRDEEENAEEEGEEGGGGGEGGGKREEEDMHEEAMRWDAGRGHEDCPGPALGRVNSERSTAAVQHTFISGRGGEGIAEDEKQNAGGNMGKKHRAVALPWFTRTGRDGETCHDDEPARRRVRASLRSNSRSAVRLEARRNKYVRIRPLAPRKRQAEKG